MGYTYSTWKAVYGVNEDGWERNRKRVDVVYQGVADQEYEQTAGSSTPGDLSRLPCENGPAVSANLGSYRCRETGPPAR